MTGANDQHVCAYCGELAEGAYSIHRDGFGEGPQVDLCNRHGGGMVPTLVSIWRRIRLRRASGQRMTTVGAAAERRGRRRAFCALRV